MVVGPFQLELFCSILIISMFLIACSVFLYLKSCILSVLLANGFTANGEIPLHTTLMTSTYISKMNKIFKYSVILQRAILEACPT